MPCKSTKKYRTLVRTYGKTKGENIFYALKNSRRKKR